MTHPYFHQNLQQLYHGRLPYNNFSHPHGGVVPLFCSGYGHGTFTILNTQLKNQPGSYGAAFVGILHLFLLNLANDSSLIAAITIWLMASLYFGLFYGIGGWILTLVSKKENKMAPTPSRHLAHH